MAKPRSRWQSRSTEPETHTQRDPRPRPPFRGRRAKRRRSGAPRHPVARRWTEAAADWPGSALLLLVVGLVGSLAFSGVLDGVVVDRGPALWAVVAVSGAGALLGLATRPPDWWRRRAPWVAAATTVVVVLAWAWLRSSGLTGNTPYPASFLVLAWLALFALGSGLTGLHTGPQALRTTRILAGPAAVLGVFLVINAFYGYWPTVGTLLGHPLPGQVSGHRFAAALRQRKPTTATGELGPVSIPGTAVGFQAARAYLWIPPDWSRVRHADLPVIVTLTGIPGTALDWARAGGALAASSTWAASHGGLAPPVLMLNQNGLADHDTECLDSREGAAYSYLTQVVPHYITHVLGIRHVSDRWGLVGFSEGGTCSLMLSLTDHRLFGRFVDIAGDAAPDFGPGGRLTLKVLYHGNRALERAHTPRLLLAHHRYPSLQGWFAAGLQDRGHRVLEPKLAADAARAGIRVSTYWAPGHHTWTFARIAFEHLYPSFVRSLLAGR
ncbi:hypothetical protein GHK86_07605 [Acidimicrobiaceae bacterium USS-CC1]|uniref:Esterase n=1 Tax=Acidiferrimicrobium australe TaxID=2664430 RepID=A0ABW9QSE1_9ACTN|nr:hypothetical protein [Acidiferrimicrobium australe]